MATAELNLIVEQVNTTKADGAQSQSAAATRPTNEAAQSVTVPAIDRSHTAAVMDTDKDL